MQKLKIKLLSLKYQKELKSDNKEHLKDYIVTKSIANLDERRLAKIQSYNLYELIWGIYFAPDKINFIVPSLYEIEKYEKQLKKELSSFSVPVGCDERLVAATWIKLMLQYEMISEKEVIDLTKYKIKDFITDSKLKKELDILKNNDYNFEDSRVYDEEDFKVKKR